jgi:hypothetical protein
MSLTAQEKQIYNSFLVASRAVKNQAFKIRKDFTKLDDKSYIVLKKLSSFFNSYTHINYNDFFSAPYIVNGVDNYFELSFFTTRQAIKCYTVVKNQVYTTDPDNEETIKKCKECCSFLHKYCKESNISLQDYKTQINGTTPTILQHLRDHNINFYILHGLDCSKTINKVEPELLDFFIKDFNMISNETRINFQRSTRLKSVIREALSIVDKNLLQVNQNTTTTITK